MKAIYGVAAALALLLADASAAAQTKYPERTVRILVGFLPGGPADIAARLVADKLALSWDKPVIVDNVPGATGNIATERAAKAAPDGHTLLMATSANVIFPSLFKLAFDPIKDLAAISQVCVAPNMLVVNNAVPARSVSELVALARARPGMLTFGSGGVGTTQHLAGELFKSMAALDLRHVPYRSQWKLATNTRRTSCAKVRGVSP
jgi:tripartite-type tricarboxylate transporter receptor subunit TctC